MSRQQRFAFAVELSLEFLAVEPALAQEWLDARRAKIAEQAYATGPRGGTYRLMTPPDDWRVNVDPFWRPKVALYVTKRYGQYVRPSRVRSASGSSPTFGSFTIPVKDGQAMLPTGARCRRHRGSSKCPFRRPISGLPERMVASMVANR